MSASRKAIEEKIMKDTQKKVSVSANIIRADVVKAVSDSIAALVSEVETFDSRITELDAEREKVVSARAAVLGKLEAVRVALGLTIGVPAKSETDPLHRRVVAWVKDRQTAFDLRSVYRAFRGEDAGALRWHIRNMERRREVVRIEGKKFLRADLVTVKAKSEKAPVQTSPRMRQEKIGAIPEAGTSIRSLYEWAKTQPSTFTYTDAMQAFNNDKSVGMRLSVLRMRKLLRSTCKGVYEFVGSTGQEQDAAVSAGG